MRRNKYLEPHGAMVIYAITLDLEIPKEEIEFFESLMEELDFEKAIIYWPLLWLTRGGFYR